MAETHTDFLEPDNDQTGDHEDPWDLRERRLALSDLPALSIRIDRSSAAIEAELAAAEAVISAAKISLHALAGRTRRLRHISIGQNLN